MFEKAIYVLKMYENMFLKFTNHNYIYTSKQLASIQIFD